jgi:hypothetical protein
MGSFGTAGKDLARSLNSGGRGFELPGVRYTVDRLKRSRRATRAAVLATALLGSLGVALLGAASPAAADVVVTPGEAVQGDGADLTLQVTNESPTASVTAIAVELPAATPIAEVYPLSVADWAPAMTYTKIDKPVESLHGYEVTDVTSAITWVAMPDRALPPGGRTELFLSIGPLPAVDRLTLSVVLTNSDGTQVRWNGAPGEHAAPSIVLKAGPAGRNAHAAAHGGGAQPAADAALPDTAAESGGSYGGWALAVLLLIAGITVFGLVLQHRRSPLPAADPPVSESISEDDSEASEKKPMAEASV